jgi:hypothetical protein
MLLNIIVFVVVIVSNAGVVHSFHHGGSVVDRRVVSLLTIPIQRQRRIDHLMNIDHTVVSREGGRGFFVLPHILTRRQQYGKSHNDGVGLASTNSNNDDDIDNIDNNNEGGGEDKFSFYQRIESVKTAIHVVFGFYICCVHWNKK